MKKLVAVSILLTLLTVAAFAQFTIGIDADFFPELMRATAPVGDANDDTLGGGAYYGGIGTFDFFSTHTPWKGSELRLNLGYTEPGEERYGALLQFSLDGLIARGAKYLDGDPTAGQNPPEEVSLLDWVQAPFGDWNVWGKLGILKGYVGNTADRGVAGNMRYNDTTISAFFDNVQMGNYGIIRPVRLSQGPVANPLVQWGYQDTFNLGRYPSTTGQLAKPYFSLTADLAPLKIALAGDMDNEFFESNAWDGNGYNQVGAAVRVSGADIADLLSFDVIYKIHGGDPVIDDRITGAVEQPNGEGRWGHNFGAVVNLSLIDSLGIGVGYSGAVGAREKQTNGTDRFVYPYYNGIDLRFNFTGVDKLTVNFNNNISFATISGDNNTDTVVYDLLGGGDLQEDQSWGYLGLYNALGLKYQITEDLYGSLQFINSLSSATFTDANDDKTLITGDIFRAILGAGYNIGKVDLETGLAFDINTTVIDRPNGGTNNFNGGAFTFAIPIRFKVSLP
jgi:hypothetical protein